MRKQILIPVLLNKLVYYQRIKNIFGSNLLAYYPLDEESGTVATDRSGNGRNGTYANVTLSNAVGPSGKKIPRFTGTNGESINIAAAGSVLPATEGFMWAWGKAFNAAVWTDGIVRQLLYFLVNGTNYVLINKQSANNSMRGLRAAGGTGDGVSPTMQPSGLFHFGISWSDSGGRVRVYRNGEQTGGDQTGLGTWAGTVATSLIGAGAVADQVWNGWIGGVGLINREPTALEVRNIVRYAPNGGIYRLSVIGDSISINIAANWAELVAEQWHSGAVGLINHAVAGHSIASNMATDVATALSDYANLGIFAMGANDDNGGNMTTLQATYEAGITTFATANPSATIYALGIPPIWTDGTGTTPVDKENIRTMEKAACTSLGITYIDLYDTPVYDATGTDDGIHPNEGVGHPAIYARVIAAT